jgi:hypothetical protein
MLESAPVDNSATISVVDFRRRSMVLRWHALGGTWTAYEFPPSLVNGVALISATGSNICVFGQGGRLLLQIGHNQYALAADSPRIICRNGWILLGLRRRFLVKSDTGSVLFSHRYWRGQGRDFFHWFAQLARDPDRRVTCGMQWSEGVDPATLSMLLRQ